jgi:hypothetical protein
MAMSRKSKQLGCADTARLARIARSAGPFVMLWGMMMPAHYTALRNGKASPEFLPWQRGEPSSPLHAFGAFPGGDTIPC